MLNAGPNVCIPLTGKPYLYQKVALLKKCFVRACEVL